MPLYEYECGVCHRRTEKIQKFSAEPLTTCPHCGAEALERTITAPSFQFAGGGWYKDLYSSAKPAAGGESKPSTGTSEPAKPAAPAPAAAPAATSSKD